MDANNFAPGGKQTSLLLPDCDLETEQERLITAYGGYLNVCCQNAA